MHLPKGPTPLGEFLSLAATAMEESELHFGHGTDNAYDEAVWLTLHAIGDSAAAPASTPDRVLSAAEINAARELIQRRIESRTPAAYLTQQAWFCGLEFYVDERVLVPRSPIAELIQDGFRPWYSGPEPRRILDLCTGSGCIAMACARKFSDARVDATDLSADALAVATINRQRLGLENRVEFIQGDLFSPLEARKYDLIVTNPPYVGHPEIAGLDKEFTAEPLMGFDGGPDGLDLVAQILLNAGRHLAEHGVLVVEVGDVAATEKRFANFAFTWPEFAHGGTGVFVLQAEQLLDHTK